MGILYECSAGVGSCERSATAATRRRASGRRSLTARTGTAQRTGRPRRAPGGGLPSRRRRNRRGTWRCRRRGTFGRKARVHHPAAAAGTAAFDEYATIQTEGAVHRRAVMTIAVDDYVTFGWKAQLHPPVAVVAAAAVSEYSTSSGRCTASRRLSWSPRPGLRPVFADPVPDSGQQR